MVSSDSACSQIISLATEPRVWRCALTSLAGLSVLMISSCQPAGDGLSRIAVVGSVTSSSGEPISGTISFLPEAGTKGPAATASVVEGDFKFDKSNGPVAGNYRVLVVGQLRDLKYKGTLASISSAPNAEATTGDSQSPPAAEWSFDAEVSPDDFDFDFEVPAS